MQSEQSVEKSALEGALRDRCCKDAGRDSGSGCANVGRECLARVYVRECLGPGPPYLQPMTSRTRFSWA